MKNTRVPSAGSVPSPPPVTGLVLALLLRHSGEKAQMLAMSCVDVSVSGWLKELNRNGSRYERKGKEVNTKCGNKQISTVGH